MKTVYVGLSGGVDSSVSAALLKEQGFNVVGVYMKNWARDLKGWQCPWREDLADAKRVAVQLDIPFKIFDFQDKYFDKVVKYLIDGYKRGDTPNPDVMCNQEIKFKLFLETALDDGADMIATGHYARIEKKGKTYQLLSGKDKKKDQSYFLYRITQEALGKTLFPLGEMTKTQVRAKAEELGLVTAKKKDSVGICFVGEIGIKEFLGNFVESKPGPIINQNNQEVGQHDGALFYTLGQRHGLDVGGGLPYYVTAKDMSKNTVYVTSNLDDQRLWLKQIKLLDPHWIDQPPADNRDYEVRVRYQSPLVSAKIASGQVKLGGDVKAVTSGQSVVVYDKSIVVGGGIIG